ncbi:hypothetical protein EYF80_042603 [Liparis tanakae]|uniref:Uncharacterized protein n=1 Tax=Liparis tanakae TaxID=230148 RepID=A0A4Z2G3U3_9TELE|nr:hypothetical protein EYF80_042603 [Liparis tanakae]
MENTSVAPAAAGSSGGDSKNQNPGHTSPPESSSSFQALTVLLTWMTVVPAGMFSARKARYGLASNSGWLSFTSWTWMLTDTKDATSVPLWLPWASTSIWYQRVFSWSMAFCSSRAVDEGRFGVGPHRAHLRADGGVLRGREAVEGLGELGERNLGGNHFDLDGHGGVEEGNAAVASFHSEVEDLVLHADETLLDAHDAGERVDLDDVVGHLAGSVHRVGDVGVFAVVRVVRHDLDDGRAFVDGGLNGDLVLRRLELRNVVVLVGEDNLDRAKGHFAAAVLRHHFDGDDPLGRVLSVQRLRGDDLPVDVDGEFLVGESVDDGVVDAAVRPVVGVDGRQPDHRRSRLCVLRQLRLVDALLEMRTVPVAVYHVDVHRRRFLKHAVRHRHRQVVVRIQIPLAHVGEGDDSRRLVDVEVAAFVPRDDLVLEVVRVRGVRIRRLDFDNDVAALCHFVQRGVVLRAHEVWRVVVDVGDVYRDGGFAAERDGAAVGGSDFQMKAFRGLVVQHLLCDNQSAPGVHLKEIRLVTLRLHQLEGQIFISARVPIGGRELHHGGAARKTLL